jgi:hypothetical protein
LSQKKKKTVFGHSVLVSFAVHAVSISWRGFRNTYSSVVGDKEFSIREILMSCIHLKAADVRWILDDKNVINVSKFVGSKIIGKW